MFAKYVSNDIHLNIFFSYTYGIRAFSIAGQDKCSELTKKVDLLRHSSLNFGWLEQIFSWEREFATLERLKVPLLGDLESKVRKCPMGCISPPSSLTLYGKWCVWEFGVRGVSPQWYLGLDHLGTLADNPHVQLQGCGHALPQAPCSFPKWITVAHTHTY